MPTKRERRNRPLEANLDELSALTILDAAQLTKMLEEKWGVSAARPVSLSAVLVESPRQAPELITLHQARANLVRIIATKLLRDITVALEGQGRTQQASTTADILANVKNALLILTAKNTLEFALPEGQLATPDYLANTILPFMQSVSELQQIVDELLGRPTNQLQIKSIRINSVSVDFDGGSEIVKWLRDVFEKWRQRHARRFAQLQERELETAIKAKQLELDRLRGREKIENEKLVAETVVQREQAEQIRLQNERLRQELRQNQLNIVIRENELTRMQLENAKLKVELERDVFRLAVEFVDEVRPDLSEEEKYIHVIRAKQAIDKLLSLQANPVYRQ